MNIADSVYVSLELAVELDIHAFVALGLSLELIATDCAYTARTVNVEIVEYGMSDCFSCHGRPKVFLDLLWPSR